MEYVKKRRASNVELAFDMIRVQLTSKIKCCEKKYRHHGSWIWVHRTTLELDRLIRDFSRNLIKKWTVTPNCASARHA